MEGNWRPTQLAAAEASMASSIDASSAGARGDWRSQLQPEARQRIVNKIMETLKRHLPISVPEGLNELRKIAIRFEENIYTAATSQSDYLRKISLKMLSMETKNPPVAQINPVMPNLAPVNQNPTEPALQMSQQQQRQQLQQRHIQQQLIQQQQRQQLQQRHIQQQLIQQQQRQLMHQQLMHQQQKQQQASQLSGCQAQQLHSMNELNELKARQGSGIKPGLYEYSAGQRHNYYNQQLKPGNSYPVSSPQNLQASSPQISHHFSPQIDQNGLLSSIPKFKAPMQSANSPLIVTHSTPFEPLPMSVDSEKPLSTISSVGHSGHQQPPVAPHQPHLLAVNTPGILTSPLLAECTSQDGSQANVPPTSKTSATERPIARLIKVVRRIFLFCS